MKPLLFLLLTIASACAGEQSFTHRITGLFSRDREADLRAALEKLPAVRLESVDFDHAEAVFTYDPPTAFKNAKPEQIVERFNDIIGTATNHTLGIAPLDPTPKDKLTRVEIPVAGLDCKACCLAAYESIYKIAGVAQAAVSFKAGRLTALIDPEKTNRAALEDALTKRNVSVTK